MRFSHILLLLLSACATTQPAGNAVNTVVFDCDGGYQFTVQTSSEKGLFYLPNGTRELGSSQTASGVLYADEQVRFLTRGDEGRLEITGQVARQCRSNRAAAIWQDARFRGVDFRAIGNEPGWYLELDREKIIYAGQYGRQVLRFSYAPPQINDSQAQTIYNALSGDDHLLEMKLQSGLCVDSMSGEKFGTRVTLKLDGTTFYGCGRALH